MLHLAAENPDNEEKTTPLKQIAAQFFWNENLEPCTSFQQVCNSVEDDPIH